MTSSTHHGRAFLKSLALVGVLAALSILGDAHGQSYTLTQTIPNPAGTMGA